LGPNAINSVSGEETFLTDTDDRKVLRACLRAQAEDISARLKRRRLGAHTVQVKVRYGDFATLTRQITVETPLTEASDIYRLGCFLLCRDTRWGSSAASAKALAGLASRERCLNTATIPCQGRCFAKSASAWGTRWSANTAFTQIESKPNRKRMTRYESKKSTVRISGASRC